MKNKHLKNLASKLRQEVFKSFIIKKEAHLGGAFSMIEILISIFEVFLKRKDKFILSKSHSSFPLILYLRKKGFKPKLTTHLEIDVKNKIFCTTGSLGHGLPIAVGMAFAKKKLKEKGLQSILVSNEQLLGKYVANDIKDKSAENIITEGFDITEEQLEKQLRERIETWNAIVGIF